MPVEAYDRAQSKKLASGSLLTIGQPDRPHDRHGAAQGDVRKSRITRCFRISSSMRAFSSTCCAIRVIVPSAAIQRGSQGTFVYVVRPDLTAEVRPVTIGEIQGGSAAMSKGLTPANLSWWTAPNACGKARR